MVRSVQKVFISRTLVVASTHEHYVMITTSRPDCLSMCSGEHPSLGGEGGTGGLNKGTPNLSPIGVQYVLDYTSTVFCFWASTRSSSCQTSRPGCRQEKRKRLKQQLVTKVGRSVRRFLCCYGDQAVGNTLLMPLHVVMK